MAEDGFVPLLNPTLEGWRMAGRGSFVWNDEGVIESRGGSGLLWYTEAVFENFVLRVDWRVLAPEDNSGVFLRCPPLGRDDLTPAIERGYEIQIDERGVDPEADALGSALHVTGAIYKLAPAISRASHPVGTWNRFEIRAEGRTIDVTLNGTSVARLENGPRESRGHVALQAHHEGSRVQFRDLEVRRL
jgi:Domain of Unknown Function (DUF1080)